MKKCQGCHKEVLRIPQGIPKVCFKVLLKEVLRLLKETLGSLTGSPREYDYQIDLWTPIFSCKSDFPGQQEIHHNIVKYRQIHTKQCFVVVFGSFFSREPRAVSGHLHA